MYFINIFSNYVNDWQFIERLTTAVDQFELLLPLTLPINQFTFYVSSREVTKIPPHAQKPLPKCAFNVYHMYIIFLRFKRWTSLMSFLPLTPALRVKLR